MASDSRPTVVVTRSGRRVQWLLASALALLGLAGFLVVRITRGDQAGMQAAVDDVRASLPAATPAPPAPAEPAHLRPRAPKADRKKTEEPTFTTLAPGEKAGLAVFPPPGTKPVKQGIIVPDDFELPEGYVRHYQTTDDGRRLPPVLMFHPDYEGVDADGTPVPLPEDRVVPPEMAPRGMPIRRLDDPDHAGASPRPGGMVGGPAATDGGR